MHPTVLRALVALGGVMAAGTVTFIAARTRVVARLGAVAPVQVTGVSSDAVSASDSVGSALDVKVVSSVGGTRPRIVLDFRNDGDSTIQRLYAMVSFRSGPRSVTSGPVTVADEQFGPLARGATRRVLLKSEQPLDGELPWYGGPYVTAAVYASPPRAGLGERVAGLLTGLEVGQR